MGNRRSDEPTKTKKGLSSFLDAARWNRGEPQGEVPGIVAPHLPHVTPPPMSRFHQSHRSHLSFQPRIFGISKWRLMVIIWEPEYPSWGLERGGRDWEPRLLALREEEGSPDDGEDRAGA